MKTDYISPGAAAMSRLRRTTASARQIQREQLQAILRQMPQRNTGRAMTFPTSAPWPTFSGRSPSPVTRTMSPTSRHCSPAAPAS